MKTKPFLAGRIWRLVMVAAGLLLTGAILYAAFLLLALVNGRAL